MHETDLAVHLIRPDWPAPAQVRSLQTTRAGGVSQGPWASFNLGTHVGDDPAAVAENRRRLAELLPAPPLWLDQVHGTRVVEPRPGLEQAEGDGAVSRRAGAVCAVMTADCLPVLCCDRAGSVVGAAHAGWRGLLAGILENTVAAMAVPGQDLLVWLGPAIGPRAFQVGDEVRAAFLARDPGAAACFMEQGGGKCLADLYGLARRRLEALGVTAIYGGQACTHGEPERYFSYRRDGVTGRMASLIWLERV